MYCREIVDILKTLKRTRDMSVNEARLIIAIEDPRARERRSVGIEVRHAACSIGHCVTENERMFDAPGCMSPTAASISQACIYVC